MNRTVVITGASGGLGKAIADLYRAGGDRVCGLSRSACDEEKDEYRCDVTDEAQVNAAVEKIAAKYGRIDVVINNAGVGVLGATELIPTESIRKAFDVSYYGSLHVSRACLKHMARGGRIIFISSRHHRKRDRNTLFLLSQRSRGRRFSAKRKLCHRTFFRRRAIQAVKPR